MPKILIVDDHPLYREGVVHALSGHPLHAIVIGVPSAERAVEVLDEDPTFELVLVDLRLQGEDGLDGLRRIALRHPSVARMLLSADDGPEVVARAMRAGAQGFLSKSLSIAEMLAAIERVLEGEVFWSSPTGDSAGSCPEILLTPRQEEVLRLLAEGHSNAEIAATLGIAERTVKAHLGSLFDALGADSRTRAVARARQLGLTP